MSELLVSNTESVACQVKTTFVKHAYDFCWSLEDFPKYPSTFAVRSPKFHPIKDLSFYARIEASGSGDSYNNLDFIFVQESGDNVEVSHQICITDGEGNELRNASDHKYRSGYKTKSLFQGRGFDQPVLILKCKMEFFVSSTDIVPKHPMPSPSENSPILVEDLRAMYNDTSYADLRLKVGETAVLVHKALLCARSPVFAKMFKSPMTEKEKDVVAINGIEISVVYGLLEFLYTGVLINDDFDFVYDLYYAAVKYEVSSLKKTCTDVLLAKLDVENACRVLCLADRHSDEQFKDAVMNFIKFHFDDILDTDSWDEFLDDDTELAAEVMRRRSQKSKNVNEIK